MQHGVAVGSGLEHGWHPSLCLPLRAISLCLPLSLGSLMPPAAFPPPCSGAPTEGDEFNTVWVLDSNQLGFNRAEQYHQFHNGLGTPMYCYAAVLPIVLHILPAVGGLPACGT